MNEIKQLPPLNGVDRINKILKYGILESELSDDQICEILNLKKEKLPLYRSICLKTKLIAPLTRIDDILSVELTLLHAVKKSPGFAEEMKWTISDSDRELYELLRDLSNVSSLLIDFEDYKPHYERTIKLLQEFIDKNLTKAEDLENYKDHIAQWEQFYLDIQTNPKYAHKFVEFPGGR